MTFQEWMNQVDEWTWRLTGCSVHDLPDCPFCVWHEDGVSAKEAARRAVKRDF